MTAKLLLNQMPKLFPLETVEEVATQLRSDETEWTFHIEYGKQGSGYATIKCLDEDGEFLGYI